MSTAKDKGARPWTRSAAGVLLGINFPWMDGLEYRPMAHVFELAEGGLAWADHGWSYPMNPGHPFHVERGMRIGQLLLGSVAERVVRLAEIPVLVVKG